MIQWAVMDHYRLQIHAKRRLTPPSTFTHPPVDRVPEATAPPRFSHGGAGAEPSSTHAPRPLRPRRLCTPADSGRRRSLAARACASGWSHPPERSPRQRFNFLPRHHSTLHP